MAVYVAMRLDSYEEEPQAAPVGVMPMMTMRDPRAGNEHGAGVVRRARCQSIRT